MSAQPLGCWDRWTGRGSLPLSFLPSALLALGLSAHLPAPFSEEVAARRPGVTMTTKLPSRPEPPAPPHLCPGNRGPSFLNHYERSEGQDPSVVGVRWINEYRVGWIGGWLERDGEEGKKWCTHE